MKNIIFNSAKEQAEYYFTREFNTTPLTLIEKAANKDSLFLHDCVVFPSDSAIIREYIEKGHVDYNDLKATYIEDTERPESDFNEDDFYEWCETTAVDCDELWDYKHGDMQHYPMWGYVFRCDRFYIDSEYCDVDKLYSLGIGVLEFDGEYYLFISGAGYDFYDAHWIPLFSMLGWIEQS